MRHKQKYFADIALTHKMLRGKQAAFDEFFAQYYSRIFRFCCRRVNSSDAEEVAMMTMEQAMRRIETYRGEASLLTWVYQIARSQMSAFFKREQKHEHLELSGYEGEVLGEVELMMLDSSSSPQQVNEEEQNNQMIHMMLDYLPSDYGRVLEWKYIEGFSVEEIATRLKTTPTAIQSMLARARRAFKDTYQNMMSAHKVVPFPSKEVAS